jgi:hypothetical protein
MGEGDSATTVAATTAMQRPTISVSYSGYQPPFDVAPIVRRMLDSVPPQYLSGLSEVVLTDSASLSRKRRRSVTKSRQRKVSMVQARGLYHPTSQGARAWIEIFVDNVLRGWEKGLWLRIPLIREGRVGDVLFHEIGHHIHFTHRPEYREREDVADVWKVRLERGYIESRHRLMGRFGRLLRWLNGPLFDKMRMKAWQKQFLNGAISRAEFEEGVGKKRRAE